MQRSKCDANNCRPRIVWDAEGGFEARSSLSLMRNFNIPITRENYLDLAYMGDVPSPLSAEEEAELPPEIRQFFPKFNVSNLLGRIVLWCRLNCVRDVRLTGAGCRLRSFLPDCCWRLSLSCSPDGRQRQDFPMLAGGVQQAHRLTLLRKPFSSLCCHSVLSDPRSG